MKARLQMIQKKGAIDIFEKAILAIKDKKYDEAQKYFEILENDYPEELALKERLKVYKKLIELKTNPPKIDYSKYDSETLFQLGVHYYNQSKVEEALNLFFEASEKDPKNAKIYYNIACIYAKWGNIEEAKKYLLIAIESNPNLKEYAKDDDDLKNIVSQISFK